MATIAINTANLLAITAIAALASHHLIFRRYELDKYSAHILSAGVISHLFLAVASRHASVPSPYLLFMFSAVYISAVFTSILIYRLWFHPLHNFPGPFMARTSSFWQVFTNIKSDLRWRDVSKKLQEEYGDFVRTGPRELTVFDARATVALNGVQSKVMKGPWYDGVGLNLMGIRDKNVHKKRRRVWDQAFSMKSLADLTPVMDQQTDILLQRFSESVDAGKNVCVTDWCFFYSYDIMSVLAFGTCLDLLKSAENRWLSELVHSAMAVFGILTPCMWVMHIAKLIPGMAEGLMRMERYSMEEVKKRKTMKHPKPDLFKYLIGGGLTDEILQLEARLIILAGSDTTFAVLTLALLHLALHPSIQQKLRVSILESFPDHSSENLLSTKCEYLEAVITEITRLHPAVPPGLQRLTPKEGCWIGSTFIPGDTLVFASTYNIQRDPRYFVKPDEFIPERWTTSPELVIDKTAFAPFSTGPAACVGRNVAQMEIRCVLMKTLRLYEIAATEGFDREVYFGGVQDKFTTALPGLELRFRKL
ncbi:cytochrome P450 monooxygenase-like protein [Trichophaea hybrida]|nr:cytochrome P450 monooxygenase-like protein [Trichophaea hybrida]